MKKRIVEIKPDAERPGWELFITDDTGQPEDVSDADEFTVKVRMAGTDYPIEGEVTAGAPPTLDRDQADDVPSILFEPAAGALASITSQGPAQVRVYVGSGDVAARYDFPARVVP